METEGYAGRADFPARQNHRIVPLTLLRGGLGISVFAVRVLPPTLHRIERPPRAHGDRAADVQPAAGFSPAVPALFHRFQRRSAIVGGSILSHEHFQGGNYAFPMAKAPVEHAFSLQDFPGISAGVVRWPLSVIRLRGEERGNACRQQLRTSWRYGAGTATKRVRYSGDPAAASRTIPSPRSRGSATGSTSWTRCCATTARPEEHPLGIFHPHAEYHHIKKENIGLIEVMGMAILPARLREELQEIGAAIRRNKPFTFPDARGLGAGNCFKIPVRRPPARSHSRSGTGNDLMRRGGPCILRGAGKLRRVQARSAWKTSVSQVSPGDYDGAKKRAARFKKRAAVRIEGVLAACVARAGRM